MSHGRSLFGTLASALVLTGLGCSSSPPTELTLCASFFRERAADAGSEVHLAVGEQATLTYQGPDDWEGQIPACWAGVDRADGSCDNFFVDPTAPGPGWERTHRHAGPCFAAGELGEVARVVIEG